MGLAEQAQLAVVLKLKDGLSGPLRSITSRFSALDLKTASVSHGLSNISKGIGLGLKRAAVIGGVGIAFLATQVNAGLDSLAQLQDVETQTAARILATGGAAGLTAKDIRDLAQKYEDLTTVDDKVQQGAENILLSYTHLTKDAFEPALLAANNVSKAMGTDLPAAAKAVGRALDDPISGLSRLSRLGVTFTQEQKDQVKAMVAAGDTLGAQNLILKALSDRYGGSAAAAANTYRGTQNRLHDAVEDLRMAFATGLAPAIVKVSTKLSAFLRDPAVVQKITDLGNTIAGLFSDKNLEAGGGVIKDVFGYLSNLPWDTIKDGLKISAEAAKSAVDAFKSLPPNVQGALITLLAANKLTGGLVASGLGELLQVGLRSLTTINAANVTVVGANVAGGGVPGVGGGKGGLAGTVGKYAGLAVVGYTAITAAPTIEKELSALQDRTITLPEMNDVFQSGPAGTALGSLIDGLGSLLGMPGITTAVQSAAEAKAAAGVTGGLLAGIQTAITGNAVPTINRTNLDLLDHIDIAKRAAAAGANKLHAAITHNTDVLRHKKLQVSLRNNTTVSVSAREVYSETQTFTRWGGVTLG